MPLFFYKGKKEILGKAPTEDAGIGTNLEVVRKEILQVFDVKNLSFLLGAGCSSCLKKEKEVGIPTMKPLAKNFYANLEETDKTFIKDTVGIDIEADAFKENLEKFLEVLFSFKFLIQQRKDTTLEKQIIELISKVTKFLLKACIDGISNKDKTVVELYKLFYKKLVYRDNNLSKTNIFTTNYDLFSETALDQLGIIYSNGFSGNIERYFNPTVFNYAYAEQMDLSNNKWNVIDNFVYLYKLHGSTNWIESDQSGQLFHIREVQESQDGQKPVMIYPTPLKQSASFGSPYSDLFREFQRKLMQDKNILITIGYSFSDEHINNLVYQALTIPSFRIVIFGTLDNPKIKELYDLDDPRIWIIGGEEDKISYHYFQHIVEKVLPNIEDQQKIEDSVKNVLKKFLN